MIVTSIKHNQIFEISFLGFFQVHIESMLSFCFASASVFTAGSSEPYQSDIGKKTPPFPGKTGYGGVFIREI